MLFFHIPSLADRTTTHNPKFFNKTNPGELGNTNSSFLFLFAKSLYYNYFFTYYFKFYIIKCFTILNSSFILKKIEIIFQKYINIFIIIHLLAALLKYFF
jgi:hypothetical protein